jgi:hypothetical protein
MTFEEIVNHIRNRSYMSGIERDKLRIKSTGEVFTPTPVVQGILNKLDQTIFTDPTKTFIRKVENGIDFEQALSTIYGVDIMQDNVQLCRERLLCGQTHLRHIVEKNIVQHDALTYNYTFGDKEVFGNDLFEVN